METSSLLCIKSAATYASLPLPVEPPGGKSWETVTFKGHKSSTVRPSVSPQEVEECKHMEIHPQPPSPPSSHPNWRLGSIPSESQSAERDSKCTPEALAEEGPPDPTPQDTSGQLWRTDILPVYLATELGLCATEFPLPSSIPTIMDPLHPQAARRLEKHTCCLQQHR